MTTDDLELVQSPISMSSRDQRAYTLDTTDYGGTPTSVAASATNLSTGKVVTSQVLSGAASVTGDVITWPIIQNLIEGQQYAIDIEFVCLGQRYERRLVIFAVM